MQFNIKNEPLTWDDFINEYQKHYFLGYPSELIKRNFQSSEFVERKIENILKNGLTSADLTLVVAWKLGNIDHIKSVNSIHFLNNCDVSLVFKTQYSETNCGAYFRYIEENFQYITELANNNPQEAFNILCDKSPRNFGPTYVLTLLFFFTCGNFPIFDKYAFFALLAIANNTLPKQKVIGYTPIDYGVRGWKIYMNYYKLLLDIAGDRYKDRSVDRTLWVYGHRFNS